MKYYQNQNAGNRITSLSNAIPSRSPGGGHHNLSISSLSGTMANLSNITNAHVNMSPLVNRKTASPQKLANQNRSPMTTYTRNPYLENNQNVSSFQSGFENTTNMLQQQSYAQGKTGLTHNYQTLTKEYLNMRDKHSEAELIKLFEECEKEILQWKQKYQKEATMNQSLKAQIFEIMHEKKQIDQSQNKDYQQALSENACLKADLDALQYKYQNDINLLENKFIQMESALNKKNASLLSMQQMGTPNRNQNYVSAEPQMAQRNTANMLNNLSFNNNQNYTNNINNMSLGGGQNNILPKGFETQQHNDFIERLLKAGNVKENEIQMMQQKLNIMEVECNDKILKLARELEQERMDKNQLYIKANDVGNEANILDSQLLSYKQQLQAINNELQLKENIIRELSYKLENTESSMKRMADEYMKHLENVYQIQSSNQDASNEEIFKLREHVRNQTNEQQPILMQLNQEKVERLRYLEKMSDMVNTAGAGAQTAGGVRQKIREGSAYGPRTDSNQLSSVRIKHTSSLQKQMHHHNLL